MTMLVEGKLPFASLLRRGLRRCASLTAAAILSLVTAVSAMGDEPPGTSLTFERDIRPILRAHCLDCHGATETKEGGLDLRQVRTMQSGGDSGPAIDLEHPEASLLIERIDSGEMPPGSVKMTRDERDRLITWLAAGAPTARPESEVPSSGIGILPEDREWWSFRPLDRPAVPAIDDPRVRNDIDRFVLARLSDAGLDLSPEADRRTLAIRASFDLTGLPPDFRTLQAFVDDPAVDAYERLIDRLLETDAYGERWGRHWLDVAGYADSEGYTTEDRERPWAYHYRDWVIRALRDDKPIDRFILEQLAGDELFAGDLNEPDPASLDPLIATGFLRTAADGTGQGGVDEPLARNQSIADTIKIVSTSLLGVSMACAQCHDHRYDPILQEDYFRLRAILAPALDADAWQSPPQRLVSLYTSADRAAAAAVEAEAAAVAEERRVKEEGFLAAALDKELGKYDEPLKSQLRDAYRTAAGERTAEQQALLDSNPSVNISPGVLYQYDQAAADELKTYDAKIAEIRSRKPVERFLSVVREPAGHLPETKVFHRGDYRQPTTTVVPGDLSVLEFDGARLDLPLDDPTLPTSGRRLAFARHLVSGRHPLFNRVFVNRVWMHHFGRGIVPSVADFGHLGDRPSHPELLDWLACELADGGWSLKRLHRLIMTSATYCQSSAIDERAASIDAETALLWRYPLRRLEAEAIRDRILFVSGSLDRTSFGPSVPLTEDETGQVVPSVEARRSVYLQARRSKPVSFLQAFDAPIMETNCERRSFSTVAPQALMLLNSDFIGGQASRLAASIAVEAADETAWAENDATATGLNGIDWPDPQVRWEFGWAPLGDANAYDPATFRHLPYWSGSQWQGGPAVPDPELEWSLIHASGGHPGTGRAVVRRFVVPFDGRWSIDGQLEHDSRNGDGVRGRIVLGERGAIGTFEAFGSTTSTTASGIELRAGETIDLVVDGREHVTSDGFRWVVTLRGEPSGEAIDAGAAPVAPREFESSSALHGPPPTDIGRRVVAAWRRALLRDPSREELEAVAAWMHETVALDDRASDRSAAIDQALDSLCRTLLGSNEFLYVE